MDASPSPVAASLIVSRLRVSAVNLLLDFAAANGAAGQTFDPTASCTTTGLPLRCQRTAGRGSGMRQGAAWLAAALLVTVAGAAAAQGAGAAPAPFVREETLSACVDPGFAPMEFFRNPGDAQPVGFDVDVVEALAAKLGARARIFATDFKGLLPALEAGRCGIVISGMLVTPERKERYDAVPYLATHTVLMASRGTTIEAPEDLSGKVLAVEA